MVVVVFVTWLYVPVQFDGTYGLQAPGVPRLMQMRSGAETVWLPTLSLAATTTQAGPSGKWLSESNWYPTQPEGELSTAGIVQIAGWGGDEYCRAYVKGA